MNAAMPENTPHDFASPTAFDPETRPRNIGYARIWTNRQELVTPALLADALSGRGFIPGVSDASRETAAVSEVGLVDAAFVLGDPNGWRFVSLASSKGNGCLVRVQEASEADLPDDYMARRTVRRPRVVYLVEAGGPGNSDRTLCENIAECLVLLTEGVVQIGGLGTKGNRPQIYNSAWLNKIKAMPT